MPSMLIFLLIDVKMPTIVGILTFMSRKNFMIFFFIISGPCLHRYFECYVNFC